MKTEEQIRAKIEELQADDRLSYPTATVIENAGLALVQLELETKIATLKWVLKDNPEPTIVHIKYAEDGQSRAIVLSDDTSRFQVLVGNVEDQNFETQYEYSPAERDFTIEAHKEARKLQGKPTTGLLFTPGRVIR